MYGGLPKTVPGRVCPASYPTVSVEADSVSLVRGTYDPATKIGATELIWFNRRGGDIWGRQSSIVEERCYERDDVLGMLAAAGFKRIQATSANAAGVEGEIALGRTYYSAWT